MKAYKKQPESETRKMGTNIILNYNDPGRFDVCRDCPLRTAVLQLQSGIK